MKKDRSVPSNCLGAIVDDSKYWRERFPVWLSYFGFKIDSYSNYDDLFAALKSGRNYRFVFGDEKIVGFSPDGFENLCSIRDKYKKSVEDLYLFTVVSENEIDEKYPTFCKSKVTYVKKGRTVEAIADLIDHKQS